MEYKKTKLISYIKSFSKNELIDFEKFLSSPYFKITRNLVPFLKILKKFHPEFSSTDLNEKFIYNLLYPGSEYSGKKSNDLFRAMSSSLLKAVEDFISYSGFTKNKVLRKRILLEGILDKGLNKYYESYLPAAEKDLSEEEKITGLNLIEKNQLETLNNRNCLFTLQYKKSFKYAFKSLELVSVQFLLNFLRLSNLKHLTQKFDKMDHGENIADKLSKVLDIEKILKIYENTPEYVYLSFCWNTLLCISNKTAYTYYKKAKDIFFENRDSISQYEKNSFYSDLINICQLGFGDERNVDRRELFNLNKSCLEDKAYKVFGEDYMQYTFYRNVLIAAVFFKEYDWAEAFVEKYTNELHHEHRDNLKFYSGALINYGRSNFHKALEDISRVKYDLVNFKIDVKMLTLRIFYELKYFEQAYSLADAFKHYLKNPKEISENLKEQYASFLKYYIAISKLHTNGEDEKLNEIKNELLKAANVRDKQWLLEKLSELEKINLK